MAKQSDNDLLVIGEMFKTVAGEFKIIRRLGQGATGEVYQAQSRDGKRTVAIKMMRPTDMQLARRRFISEGLTLVAMRTAENKQKDGFFVTPEYFGGNEKADTPYFVEEFMTGKPFPDLVSDGHLSEEDVISIGVQLFRTLHLLSDKLKKNYIDLKFTDLWWDQEKKILKITDWGTLEETNPAGQARDILRASLYIYRLATGRPITESRGILNQAVDAYPEWGQLSWGLQEILRRLLHPNPSARVGDDLLSLASAGKIAQEFRNLYEYWKEPEHNLLEDIRLSVNTAQKADPEKEIKDQTLHYRLARTALEIASKRSIPGKEYDDRLRSLIVEESDYYTRAHNLYEGTSYAPARKLFQIGASLLSSTKLRRWAWLAYAGQLANENKYMEVRALAERAVGLMEQQQYQDAESSFDTVLKTLQSEALQTLRQECEALNLVQQAVSAQGKGEYKLAEGAYRRAYEIWIKTDDHNEWKDKVGELLNQADIVHRRGENQENVNAALKQIASATTLAIILDELHKALELDPGNPDVYALAAELAGKRFKSGILEDAAQILWACGIAPAAPPDKIDWHYPEEIRLALVPKGHLGNASSCVTAIRVDKDALPYKLAIELFKKYFIPAKDIFEVERNDVIADLVTNLDPELGKKMKEQVQGWRKTILGDNKEKVNQLIAQADGLLFADKPGTLQGLSISQAFACLQNQLQGIEKALGLLDQASRLAGSEPETVKSKITELEQRGITMKDELGLSLSENKEQNKATIAALKVKVEEIQAQLEHLESAFPELLKAGLPAQISDNMSGFQAERLGEIYELCARVLELDSENKWALQMQQKVKGQIQGFGDYAAFALISQKNVLDAAVGALLSEAQAHYQDAKALDAARSLRKIEAVDAQASSREPFMELKAKVTSLLGLKYWEQENKAKLEKGEFAPQLLERIATHFSPEIPQQFRRDSASLKYLVAAKGNLFAQLLKINSVNSDAEFAEILRNLVWTDNLYRRGLAWQNNQNIDQKDGKWDSKKFMRNVLQAYEKGDLDIKMEKLLIGFPIFLNPKARSAELTSELIGQVISEALVSSDAKTIKPQPIWWKWALVVVGGIVLIGLMVRFVPPLIGLTLTATPSPATVAPVTPTPVTATPTPVTPTNTPVPTPLTPADVQPPLPDLTVQSAVEFIVDPSDPLKANASITNPGIYQILIDQADAGSTDCSIKPAGDKLDMTPVYLSQTTWKNIGFYEFKEPAEITLLDCNLDGTPININKAFALQQSVSATSLLASFNEEFPGMFVNPIWLLDDANATLYDEVLKTTADQSMWSIKTVDLNKADDLAWGNKYHLIEDPSKRISVKWSLPDNIPTGTYKVFVWVPNVTNPGNVGLRIRFDANENIILTKNFFNIDWMHKTDATALDTTQWYEIMPDPSGWKVTDATQRWDFVIEVVIMTTGQVPVDTVLLIRTGDLP